MRGGGRDETRERFLTAVAEKVNLDRVVEVHLFQPIRQSGFESGVAVVAVREEQAPTGGAAAVEDAPDALGASTENNVHANRLAVYTARYRLTQKGPERGKWDFAIQIEADAPLVTVDKVVRGVQRRSGDAEDPERLTGEEFRALLPPPPPPPREPAQGQSA
jgi:hypothetical protein